MNKIQFLLVVLVTSASFAFLRSGSSPDVPSVVEGGRIGAEADIADSIPEAALSLPSVHRAEGSATESNSASQEDEESGAGEDSLVYTSQNIKALRAKGVREIDIRLRIFAAKLDKSTEKIKTARSSGDVSTVRAIYHHAASNIAEVHLWGTGRPGISRDQGSAAMAEIDLDSEGVAIQLNSYSCMMPAGEVPFVDAVYGIGGSRLDDEALLGDKTFELYMSALERAKLTADSMTGAERFVYPQ